MKAILIFVGFFIVTHLNGQIDFVDQLYTKIKMENIQLLDSFGYLLDPKPSIDELFYVKDTSMNCWGEPREKFINLEYWPFGISQSILTTKMASSINSDQNGLINFYKIYYEETYEVLDKIYLFSVQPKTIYPIERFRKPISLDEQIVNLSKCSWILESIKLKDQNFQLDSCHATYNLSIDSNGIYSQYYSNEVDNCDCIISKPIIIGEDYDLGSNQRIFHKLSMSSGEVRTYEKKMVLSNMEKDIVNEFDYEILNDKLILKTSNNYVITLKVNPACNIR